MTWFKVDDSFYDHPKVFDAPDCAVALWVRAGSWCARNLTDGFVPARLPARLCDDPEAAVRELVDRGLWRRTKGGYRFHDWSVYQPSKEEAAAAREKKSSGGRIGNHRRWHVDRGIRDASCPYCRSGNRSQSDRSDKSPDTESDSLCDPHPIENERDSGGSGAPVGQHQQGASSQVTGDGASDIRSVSDRSTESHPNPPVPSRPVPSRRDRDGTGSQSSSLRNAREDGPEDDDSLDLATVELLTESTGKDISILWATKVRQRILNGRHVAPRARLAYVTKAIRDNPAKFAPTGESPAPPLRAVPDWCGTCDERTRLLDVEGAPVVRCPACHPLERQEAS